MHMGDILNDHAPLFPRESKRHVGTHANTLTFVTKAFKFGVAAGIILLFLCCPWSPKWTPKGTQKSQKTA